MKVIRLLCSPRNHRERSKYGSIPGKGEGMAEPLRRAVADSLDILQGFRHRVNRTSSRDPLGSHLAVPWGLTPRSQGRDIHGFLPRYPSFVNLVAVTFSPSINLILVRVERKSLIRKTLILI